MILVFSIIMLYLKYFKNIFVYNIQLKIFS